MNTVITYDVSRRHTEVKKELRALSYFDHWISEGKKYHLPNTTLWKENIAQSAALKEMQAVIAKLNYNQPAYNQIELERCLCVPLSPWAAIPGKEHKE